jgi:hypothetical protein
MLARQLVTDAGLTDHARPVLTERVGELIVAEVDGA